MNRIERDLLNPVAYFLQKNYVRNGIWMAYYNPAHHSGKMADLAFINARRDNFHLVEIESKLSNIFSDTHGFRQLSKHRANYKWLAIPKKVWIKDSKQIISEAINRRIGVMTIKILEDNYSARKVKNSNSIFIKDYNKYKVTAQHFAPQLIKSTCLHLYPNVQYSWEHPELWDEFKG